MRLAVNRADNTCCFPLRAGKIVRLKQKLSAASDAVKSFFTGKAEQDPSVVKLEALQARMVGGGDEGSCLLPAGVLSGHAAAAAAAVGGAVAALQASVVNGRVGL
jgi:hypothetical protein